jgi:predicted RNA methylase
MRLAAQLKGGYYPAPAQAVAHAGSFLRPPIESSFVILDPCAGEGAAIGQLAHALGCPASMIYAIELDESRAQKHHASLPEAHVLGPASFFGCRASFNSFSLIWLNPPFDDGYAGRRIEDQFLRSATDWLMPGGVMALVCPEEVADEYTDVRRHFATYYQNCRIEPFPACYRRFNEVIVLGHKRSRPQGDHVSWQSVQAPPGFVYAIPSSRGPRLFQKAEPTEPELQAMLANSPLRSHLTAPAAAALPSPPLALGIGHVALLLASGQLDGVVHPPGQPPHVVRGTSRKKEFVSNVTETEDDEGRTVKRTTISERIELVVRTVDLTGKIQAFLDSSEPDP